MAPYAGVPEEKTGKMESCVKRVMGTGKSKDSAVAICHDSVVKKKGLYEPDWSDITDDEVERVVDSILSDVDNDTKENDNTKQIDYVPWGVTSFSALQQYREAQESVMHLYSVTSDFTSLVSNIMSSDTITDKGKAVKALSDEYSKIVNSGSMDKKETDTTDATDTADDDDEIYAPPKEDSLIKRVVKSVADAFGLSPKDKNSMMIWKEADGRYRWIARYSNNFRDDDKPAEIISEKSHKDFVENVDKGVYPAPELWLWHVPEWKVGYATSVAYDDSGFAIATGYFDKGMDDVAEWLSKQKDVAVSHAMPPRTIQRDPSDRSIIVAHQTVEISPLPYWAAANKLTGFVVLNDQKEADMAIPTRKREALVKEWGVDPKLLSAIEEKNASDAEKARKEGRESKEIGDDHTDQTDAVVTTDQPENKETDQPDPVKTETDPLDLPPSRKEIAEAFGSVLSELKEKIEEQSEQIAALKKELSEKVASDEERIAKAASETPVASLAALIQQSATGRKETAVNSRSNLAKSKPKETQPVSSGRTGISFIDHMIGGSDQAE